MNRIAIFVATSWEAQAVLAAGHDYERTQLAGFPAGIFPCRHAWCYVIQTGVGPQRAERVAEAVLADAKWDVAISTGFAGGLQPSRVGAVLVGESVRGAVATTALSSAGTTYPSHPLLVRLACAQAVGLGEAALCGPFVSTDRVVWRAEDKRALAALYDAVAVDMESAALAAVGQRHLVPFVIVRTVSDLVEESLPLDFNVIVRPENRVGGWLQGIAMALIRPSSWIGLITLRRHSRLAALQLTRFMAPFLQSVVQTPFVGRTVR